jgi:hypothetical protein
VADLKHRLSLVEAFVDSKHREWLGVTLDDTRRIWHGKLLPPNEDIQQRAGRIVSA